MPRTFKRQYQKIEKKFQRKCVGGMFSIQLTLDPGFESHFSNTPINFEIEIGFEMNARWLG
jgi:hypothetical protein